MQIKLNYNMGRVKHYVFVLCACSVRNLTWLAFGIMFCFQLLFASVEYLFWGELFPHAGDVILNLIVFASYFYFLFSLGDFLMELHLNGEQSDE